MAKEDADKVIDNNAADDDVTLLAGERAENGDDELIDEEIASVRESDVATDLNPSEQLEGSEDWEVEAYEKGAGADLDDEENPKAYGMQVVDIVDPASNDDSDE